MINSQFLITKRLNLYVLCKEKLGVDKWLGLVLKGVTAGFCVLVLLLWFYSNRGHFSSLANQIANWKQ